MSKPTAQDLKLCTIKAGYVHNFVANSNDSETVGDFENAKTKVGQASDVVNKIMKSVAEHQRNHHMFIFMGNCMTIRIG